MAEEGRDSKLDTSAAPVDKQVQKTAPGRHHTAMGSLRQMVSAPYFDPGRPDIAAFENGGPTTVDTIKFDTNNAFSALQSTHHRERLEAIYRESSVPIDIILSGLQANNLSAAEAGELLKKMLTLTRMRGIVDRKTFAENAEETEWVFKHAEEKAEKFNKKIDVLFLDLTGFKRINDDPELGHEKGDQLLEEIGRFLTSASYEPVPANPVAEMQEEPVLEAQNSFSIVRYGGDEFILVEVGDADDADAKHKRILSQTPERMREICSQLGISYEKYPIAFHAGMATHSPGKPYKETISEADKNMTRSKNIYYQEHPELDRRGR